MYKVAIIGSENSHAECFAQVIAPRNEESRFPDIDLIGACGDEEANAVIHRKSTCAILTDDPYAFLGKVDAVMITARHGGRHLEYARPYIEQGVHIWMDKPITASVEDARELVELVHKHNVLLTGGSCLAYANGIIESKKLVAEKGDEVFGGHVTAPNVVEEENGGWWFYSQHLIQMITEVFGQHIISVETKTPLHGHGLHATYHYPNYDVTAFFGVGYSVTVYARDSFARCKEIKLQSDYFMPELTDMANMMRLGTAPQTPEEVVYPVLVIDATIRSMNNGGALTEVCSL